MRQSKQSGGLSMCLAVRKLAVGISIALALAGSAFAQTKPLRTLVVTEPVHGIGYLPLYVAMRSGFFADEGLEIKTVTIESGSAPTNAVLTGQAFAYIAGPEHNAFAKLKGAELRLVVNVVARGNLYYVAAKGREPAAGTKMGDYVKGKTIAVGFYGGTPNSITRFLLKKWGLDAKNDVTMIELTANGIVAAVKTGNAQIGVVQEPQITQGIRNNLWGEPFFNFPKENGDYAYSALSVRLDTIQKDPETVHKFVRAVIRGLKATHADPAKAAAIAKQEFPTMAAEDLKATLDRSFADELWSPDGFVSPEAWATAHSVVRNADVLKQDVGYGQVVDMQFVQAVKAGK
jgi:NitT/TauT family transport system substrate-binding protein